MDETYKENTAKGILALIDLWLQAKIKKADALGQNELGEFGYDAPSFLYRDVKETLESMVRDAGLNPDEIFVKSELANKITAPSSSG